MARKAAGEKPTAVGAAATAVRRGRPRSEKAQRAILDATLALLAETGRNQEAEAALRQALATDPQLVRFASQCQLSWSLVEIQEAAALGACGIWIEDCMVDMISRAAFESINLPLIQVMVEEIRRLGQSHVPAAFQIKLAGLLAAEAQREEAVLAQEPDRADDSMRGRSLGVAVVERDDQIVRLMHGSVDQLTHVRPPLWLTNELSPKTVTRLVKGQKPLGDPGFLGADEQVRFRLATAPGAFPGDQRCPPPSR